MNKAILHTALHCISIGFIVLLLLAIDTLQDERDTLQASLYFQHRYMRWVSEHCDQLNREAAPQPTQH